MIFITGTDTDVGKTFVSCLLLKAFNDLNLKTFGIKPIASGCTPDNAGKLINQDAVLLQQCASIKKNYDLVNPIAFQKPIAPHIAANALHISLTKTSVCKAIVRSLQNDADIHLIEGVGGWSVPLNHEELFSDVVIELNIPIILVVGIKLGCLNHAILTYQAILAIGGTLLGWVANCITPNALCIDENIESLKNWIKAPCLGVVSYGQTSSSCLDAQFIKHRLFQNYIR
jgi:dethiobiotin synthetase